MSQLLIMIAATALAFVGRVPENDKRFGALLTQALIVTEDTQGLAKGTVILGNEDRLKSPDLTVYEGLGALRIRRVQNPMVLVTKRALLVLEIYSGSAAEAASLERGDVITTWNGPVPEYLDLENLPKEIFLNTQGGKTVHLANATFLSMNVSAKVGAPTTLPMQGGCLYQRWCPSGCYPCPPYASRFIGCCYYNCDPPMACNGGACCTTGTLV